jgi:magnesium transporter
MITFHQPAEKGRQCTDLGHCHALMRHALWIDLLNPTEQEEIIVDMAFSIDLPSHREMQDLEVSRRLYRRDDALFMTATVLAKADSDKPESCAVTFILANEQLITVRHTESLPFETFRAERESDLGSYRSAEQIFDGLIGAFIERLAEVLEHAGATLDLISHEIFRPSTKPLAARSAGDPGDPGPRDLEDVLRRLGRCSDVISRVRESLASLGRLISFFTGAKRDLPVDRVEQWRTLQQDLQALADHASFMSQKVNFLLDATLGLINIEQNAIIKIFTVAAVLFLPPTVVGTIYGMNFEHMPELKWSLGYPLAIAIMILSAVLPYQYFKRRGWF